MRFYEEWTTDAEKSAKKKLQAKRVPTETLPNLAELPFDAYTGLWNELKDICDLDPMELWSVKSAHTAYLKKLQQARLPSAPPAKSSRNVTNQLENSINMLTSSGICVTIGGKLYNGSENLIALLSTAPVSEEPLSQLKKYVVESLTAGLPVELQNIGRLLTEGSKSNALGIINAHLDKLQAAHTSASSDQLLSRPRKLDEHHSIYPATAKPDLTSKIFPQLMETKDSPKTGGNEMCDDCWDVLAQAVDRANVLCNTDATLKHFAVFGVTGRSAWFLWFERNLAAFGAQDGLFEVLSMHRVPHSHVWPLWFALHERTRTEPFWYLTEDGVSLRSTLSSITSAKFCATKIIARSQHNVYGISLPQIVRYRTGAKTHKSVIGVTLMKHDLCVKIIHDESQFDREGSIGTKVATMYNKMYKSTEQKSTHHVIGTHKVRGGGGSGDAHDLQDSVFKFDWLAVSGTISFCRLFNRNKP